MKRTDKIVTKQKYANKLANAFLSQTDMNMLMSTFWLPETSLQFT